MNLSVDGWIDAAPDTWAKGRLKNLVRTSRNGVWGKEPGEDGADVKCVRAADFDRAASRVSSAKLPDRQVLADELRRHRLSPGDLILEKSGGGERQPVGAAVLFDLPIVAVCSNFCSRVIPAADVDSRFLTYVFSAAYGQGITERNIKQTTGIQNLDADAFMATAWAYPAQEEQRRIADFLDTEIAHIDKLVALQRAVRDKLEERECAFRGGLLDDLLASCGELPLRRFVTKVEQGASPQCEAVPRVTSDEWGVLKLSAVKKGRFDPSENKRLPEDVSPVRAYEVRAGDLLVTRANTPSLVGDVAVVAHDVRRLLLPDLIYRIGLVRAVRPEFVAQVALSGRVRLLIESAARGSSQSMVKLRGEDIKEWPIPVATLGQQNDFVAEINRSAQGSGALRAAVDRQLALLAERRQSLITAAVTGQLDVTTARRAAAV